MCSDELEAARQVAENIRVSGLSIYDEIAIGDPELWLTSRQLELLLRDRLIGLSLAGLPLRTRSKVAKEAVCRALGYTPPPSFRKTQPRFPGQHFDTYIQKSDNLQVWNEELDATRRYVVARVSSEDLVTGIRVVPGDRLAELDRTGTLTQKYQARLIPGEADAELIAREDTDVLRQYTAGTKPTLDVAPTCDPEPGEVLPIESVFERLSSLIGQSFDDIGFDQERNRGAALHRLVCAALGYDEYRDDGQFPDVRHQLVEVKLQTSPTIDLGLICPNSTAPLDMTALGADAIRHCDVRYAVFYGETDGETVVLTHFYLTTGERFFERFPQFQGKVINAKLQIPLPKGFFEPESDTD